ncbi:MAG: GNAT family N-acetyltransferase [Gemmiger sp.]
MEPLQHQLPVGQAPSTAADRAPDEAAWVYLVRCADGSLYAGWTNDLARRLRAHRTGQGAKYTRMKGVAALAYARRCDGKSEALRQEYALKQLPKAEKEALAARWAADNRVTLRRAVPADAEAVVTLYNWYVTHSTATFQYMPSTTGEYRRLIADTWEAAPFLLAEAADGRLLGYACAHRWHTREAFAWDVETTIYCAPDAVGQGVGAQLYTALLALLRRQGYCNAVALIAHPNPGSEAFHKAFGFSCTGRDPRTGYKFGQWLDLGYWWLTLREGDSAPAPVRLRLPDAEIDGLLQQWNR